MPMIPKHFRELCELFASVRTHREAEMLLRDILTPQEIETIAERWQLIQAMASGLSQRKIATRCKVSISKITRGSRVMKYGTGGFKYFLRKLKKLYIPPPRPSRSLMGQARGQDYSA